MALRLLVTRPQPQADAWVERLQGAGLDACALPLLAIESVADLGALHAAWHDLPRYALVMFVSPNAVTHFFAARPASLQGRAWPAGTRAGATGPGTLQALQMAGVPPALCVAPHPNSPQFDSAALWSQLRFVPWEGREVLILRGDGGRDEFAAHLRAAGAAVHFTQAYHRRPPVLGAVERQRLAAALAAPAAHLWWLSSAEALGHLPALAPNADWAPAQALASHPRIAQRARDLGFGRVHEAAPTLAAVCEAVASITAGTAGMRCLQSPSP